MDEMEEIIEEFLVESIEQVDEFDHQLLKLEQNPEDPEIMSAIFRVVHTVKGTSSFLGFSNLESVGHVGENLLSKLREGELSLTDAMTDTLLKVADAFREMLVHIEQHKNDEAGEYGWLVEEIKGHMDGTAPTERISADDDVTEQPIVAPDPAPAVAPNPAPAAAVVAPDPAPAVAPNPAPAEAPNPAPAAAPTPAPVAAPAKAAAVPAPKAAPKKAANESGAPQSSNIAESKIRVDVQLLDKLMNLVGELVLTRNQILQFPAVQADAGLTAASQRLDVITSELQDGLMKTRMQPIDRVWAKLPRVVRDLANMCGKKVRVEMEGRETELDRTLIEAIKDPMTHIVRNSVDHGIETPESRAAAGKNPEGVLNLRAYHESGQVVIEITDDGGGINPHKVKARAIERGLVTPEAAERLTEREIAQFVFMAGFSTAAKVTTVSGRGVGMDVVKTNIEKIGGSIDIQSKFGEGTTLKVKIPLTLAIVPALIVGQGNNRYAVPQASLTELVRLERQQALDGVEFINGAPVFRLRGQLLPLVDLGAELCGTGNLENIAGLGEDDVLNIAVLQADGRPFGLVVDHINDTEEIVVKPLGDQLANIGVFSGATILGDGRVALILDVIGIAHKANMNVQEGKGMVTDTAIGGGASDDSRTLLVVRVGEESRAAIDLGQVARLEELAANRIENVGQRSMVQYRGEILPLVWVSEVLDGRRPSYASDDALNVVVVQGEDRGHVGMVVDAIIDIAEETVAIETRARRRGVQGIAPVQGRLTEFIDIKGLIQAADPALLQSAAQV